MYDLLRSNLEKRIQLSDAEFEEIKSLFAPKKLRRKQYLQQEGEPCRFLAFVNKGCLRSYIIDDKGQERIVQFAIEDWWISEMHSFLTGSPAAYNIDALEETEVLLLDARNWEPLFEKVPKLERFFRLQLQSNYVATHHRMVCNINQTAEERYTDFVQRYPAILQRVPQHMIASYLGLSAETLSRVRKQMALKSNSR